MSKSPQATNTHPDFFILQLKKELSINVLDATFTDLLKQVQSLKQSERKALSNLCRANFPEAFSNSEHARIATARVIVASIPESWELIEEWISKSETECQYELQFSLFCYLDQVSWRSELHQSRSKTLNLIENYLRKVQKTTAMAYWMAGDVLGDHWEPAEEAFCVLSRSAKQAKFVAGRMGALHGIKMLLERELAPFQNQIRELLQFVIEKDRSKRIQSMAQSILTDFEKSS